MPNLQVVLCTKGKEPALLPRLRRRPKAEESRRAPAQETGGAFSGRFQGTALTSDMRLLLQGLREFTDMKELTPTIVNKLIRRIEVHNPEKKHARKAVKVDIYFTAVGLVSLPDEQEIRRMMEQMRSTSQIPKQLTA